MMKAREVVYVPTEGTVYAAGPATGDDLEPVVQRASDLDVIGGDDIRVRAQGGRVTVESLTNHPLLVRVVGPERDRQDPTVRVRTQFSPEAEVVVGGLKQGRPVRPGGD
jgi:hypothetical protein